MNVSSTLVDVTPMVEEVLFVVDDWRHAQDIQQIFLFFNAPASGAAYQPTRSTLLPLDPDWLFELREAEWESRSMPIYTMPWQDLFASLLREYLFGSVYRAIVLSLASENASRLAAMQAAEQNIDERLSELNVEYNRQRQQAITSEILDIVSGFEALTES
jgi:F-type H+-transporting ATPase subunit gamma